MRELADMDFNSFSELISEIMTQGYDQKTACDYAVLIGDTPCTDETGQILVLKNGKEIARLKPLKFFS
jgi:hypothetical protein